MNKRELYESIMRSVSREVKKALNENDGMLEFPSHPVGDGPRNLHILFDNSGSVSEINDLEMVLKKVMAPYADHKIFIWPMNCSNKNLYTVRCVREDFPLAEKIKYTIHYMNRLPECMGGTDMARLIQNVCDDNNTKIGYDSFVLISDFDDDVRNIKRKLIDNNIIDYTICIAVDEYGDAEIKNPRDL